MTKATVLLIIPIDRNYNLQGMMRAVLQVASLRVESDLGFLRASHLPLIENLITHTPTLERLTIEFKEQISLEGLAKALCHNRSIHELTVFRSERDFPIDCDTYLSVSETVAFQFHETLKFNNHTLRNLCVQAGRAPVKYERNQSTHTTEALRLHSAAINFFLALNKVERKTMTLESTVEEWICYLAKAVARENHPRPADRWNGTVYLWDAAVSEAFYYLRTNPSLIVAATKVTSPAGKCRSSWNLLERSG